MGVAGLIFEPLPPNFENQYNFEEVLMILRLFFDTSTGFRFSDFQRSVWSVQSISVACPCMYLEVH